jgi:hypothetical protein
MQAQPSEYLWIVVQSFSDSEEHRTECRNHVGTATADIGHMQQAV